MTSSIFLSYSSKDHAVAQTICSALENRGLNCWMSSRDIGPGENFQVAIIRAIRTAAVMVIVFSGNSNNSEEVKKEVALAGQHKLLVIPVRVEDVVPAEAFQYELATRQWIDLFENWEHAIERLASQIRTLLPPQAGPETVKAEPVVQAPPPKPAQRSSAFPLILAAGLLIAASAGGVWWWKNRQLTQDNDAWAAAGQQNSIMSYQAYLQAQPDGRHAADAVLRLDELEWAAAASRNTVAGYQTYKQIETHGRHLADADSRIAALNAAVKAAADAAADARRAAAAAQQQPPAPQQPAPVAVAQPAPAAQQVSAQDEADFRKALQQHSSAEYRNYLALHASSTHVAEIRQRLASCQMVRTGTAVAQKSRIQAAGRSTGQNQADACRGAQQDGMTRLDSECPGGAVSWLRTQTLSFTPAAGCSVMVYGACAARASGAAEERCR